MKRVLCTVTGNEPRGSCTECLDELLREAGYVDETEWLLSCLRSRNPQLVQVAIWAGHGSHDSRIRDAACEVLLNRGMRGDVRWDAMRLLVKNPDTMIRLALAEIVDDQTPVLKREYLPQFHPSYPLTNSTSLWAMRGVIDWQCSHLTNTIGKEAAQNLTSVKRTEGHTTGTGHMN